jgi:Na+-driven multidrug efflux pump
MPTTFNKTPAEVLRADFRLTLRLALPLSIAEVGWMSMGIVDTIMVGRLPDSAVAIGATGLGQSLYHSVATLVATCSGPRFSLRATVART